MKSLSIAATGMLAQQTNVDVIANNIANMNTTGYKRFTNLLTVLQQEAKKAGVELNLEILEQTAGWKKTSEKQHEIAFGGLNNSVELYPRFFEPYHSYNAYKEKGDKLYNADGSLKEGITPKPDTNNATLTANRELDKLIKDLREALAGNEQRLRAFAEVPAK